LRGLHIYMGGVGLQQIFVFCFFYLAIRFQKEMLRDMPKAEHRRVLSLLYVIYAVLILITVISPVFILGDFLN
jgi:heme/copper-type cytochrome/quinol oxidase subunit 2